MHYNLCENGFCSTVIFQIQQNVSPLKLNLWKHELFQYLFMRNYFS